MCHKALTSCYLCRRERENPLENARGQRLRYPNFPTNRLNKLAKQGKLKKSLPKGKYLQLLQQRTGQKKSATNQNDNERTVSYILASFI